MICLLLFLFFGYGARRARAKPLDKTTAAVQLRRHQLESETISSIATGWRANLVDYIHVVVVLPAYFTSSSLSRLRWAGIVWGVSW